ncbi:hypothetical protein BTR23_13835 [Alkalihalophilus pseudofirmus]|nr:hypothetical protein BTR23_13835 [Alkalihalophilus pseudofirmus]
MKGENTHSLNIIRSYLEQLENDFKEFNMIKEEENPVEITFAISLKSKQVSRNWNTVQENLSKTLRSILNNTDQHFRIIIAGHEKPQIKELNHSRVTWLPVKLRLPKNSEEFTTDKLNKRKVIGAHLRKIGFSGYFMPLDADDWIHYRFVEFLRKQPLSNAFILQKGFMVNTNLKEVWVRDNFYRGCGSGSIYYFRNSDFPLSTRIRDIQRVSFKVALKPHLKVTQNLKIIKKDYHMVTTPLAIWVLGHGDNNSILKGKKDNSITAKNYNAQGEKLEEWFYDYFKIKEK